jgi:hypothetical protein
MNKNISSVFAAIVLSSSLAACDKPKEELPPQNLLTKELIASVQDGTAEIVCQNFIARDALVPDPIVIK